MDRPGHSDVEFFLGQEVERTPAFGMKTLFIVGLHTIDAIEKIVADPFLSIGNPVEHIFFGANHSFHPVDAAEWRAWEGMITHFLNKDILCSLDIPTTFLDQFHDGVLCEYNNFIPQIRVSVPFIKLWNYNTMIKIDDRDFDSTNPGVWCHRLHDLMSTQTFTPWQHYQKDKPIP
jgi:hypothetical protein